MGLPLKKVDYSQSTEEIGFIPIKENFVANCVVTDAYLYELRNSIRCHLTLQVEDESSPYHQQLIFQELFVTFANGQQVRNGKVTADYSNLCRILQKDIAELDQQSMLKQIWIDGVQTDAVVEELPDLVGASNIFWIEAIRYNGRELFNGKWIPTEVEKWKQSIFYVGKELPVEDGRIFLVGGYTDDWQDLRPYSKQVAA